MHLGQKHLIECHCILPIYKGRKPPVYHKFSVYSKINSENGKILPKYVNCNNCGVTHLVFEFCKSEIKIGKEDIGSVRSIDDIEISLPENISNLLKKYNSTIDVYEEIEDLLENNSFPINVIIKREIIDESYNLKILRIDSKNKLKILNEVIDTTLEWG